MRTRATPTAIVIYLTWRPAIALAAGTCGALAVGAPLDAAGLSSAGVVNVLYGVEAGLTTTGDQMWHQDSSDVPGACEPGDAFGAALASGDSDGDRWPDLAIGVPGEAIGAPFDDALGSSLAVGDFNCDNRADLAVGVPGNRSGGNANAGSVTLQFPQAHGSFTTEWTQNHAGIEGVAEPGDLFGTAIAAIPELRWIFLDDFQNGNVDDWSTAQGDGSLAVPKIVADGDDSLTIVAASANPRDIRGWKAWHRWRRDRDGATR